MFMCNEWIYGSFRRAWRCLIWIKYPEDKHWHLHSIEYEPSK